MCVEGGVGTWTQSASLVEHSVCSSFAIIDLSRSYQ